MKRLILLLLVWAFLPTLAFAQSTVITRPYGATSTNSSSSIAVTNTFQSIWAASTTTTGRVGCTIQNNGTNPMWVFFGAIASATKDISVKLAAGQSVSCNSGDVILKDQVSITGTSADKFFAAQQ